MDSVVQSDIGIFTSVFICNAMFVLELAMIELIDRGNRDMGRGDLRVFGD